MFILPLFPFHSFTDPKVDVSKLVLVGDFPAP